MNCFIASFLLFSATAFGQSITVATSTLSVLGVRNYETRALAQQFLPIEIEQALATSDPATRQAAKAAISYGVTVEISGRPLVEAWDVIYQYETLSGEYKAGRTICFGRQDGPAKTMLMIGAVKRIRVVATPMVLDRGAAFAHEQQLN